MATRPTWQGHLKLSLVTCPVALYTATSSAATYYQHVIALGGCQVGLWHAEGRFLPAFLQSGGESCKVIASIAGCGE